MDDSGAMVHAISWFHEFKYFLIIKKNEFPFIYQVCLTLWGKEAEDFDGFNNPILAIKGARVGEFNGGKNLSLINSSVLKKDPDLPEAHKYISLTTLLKCTFETIFVLNYTHIYSYTKIWCIIYSNISISSNIFFMYYIYIIHVSDYADGTLRQIIWRMLNFCLNQVEAILTHHYTHFEKWPKHDWEKNWIFQIRIRWWRLLI